MTLDIDDVQLCLAHATCIVIYSGNQCPACTTEQYKKLYCSERDKMSEENNELCESIFNLQQRLIAAQKINSATVAQKTEEQNG